MQTLNDALYNLYMSREVVLDECLRVSGDQNEFLRMIGEAPMPTMSPTAMHRSSRDSTPSTPPRASGNQNRLRSIHANICLHGAHAGR